MQHFACFLFSGGAAVQAPEMRLAGINFGGSFNKPLLLLPPAVALRLWPLALRLAAVHLLLLL